MSKYNRKSDGREGGGEKAKKTRSCKEKENEKKIVQRRKKRDAEGVDYQKNPA